MLIGNLISTIFNNMKQITLFFSTQHTSLHSDLQGSIGSIDLCLTSPFPLFHTPGHPHS